MPWRSRIFSATMDRLGGKPMQVMSAIESCRTVALGGHVMRCEDCLHTQIAYNSCRNRHCPKCQGSQALAWMKQRNSELLDVPYCHVVFTLPARIAAIAYQNKAVVYDLLFKASSQTMRTIAADPKRLGAKIGFTSVLHTWGSAMTHHPHVHMIVPGGGISLDGTRWIGCRPNYLLPVKVLSRLFRRLMLEMLLAAHDAGRLQFFGDYAHLAGRPRSRPISRRCIGPSGSSIASGRSPGRSRCWPICPATPTASRSPTAASSPPTRPASRSATRTTGSRDPAATRP